MQEKNDHILVTGGTGFIGAYILRELIREGYKNIYCTYRTESNLALLEGIREKIKMVQLDINDLNDLIEIMPDMDYVIHCAAIVSFNKSDKNRMTKVNIEGTTNVVNIALESGIKKLVFISSIAALGRTSSGKTTDENARWIPGRLNSFYALTKHQAEREVWRGFHEGLPMVIINPSNVLGPGFWDRGSSKFFTTIYQGLSFYPPGENGFVDVRDVAGLTVKALQSDVTGERFICNAENASYKRVFNTMAKSLGVKGPYRPLPQFFASLARMYFLVQSWITGTKPIVTRETMVTAYHSFTYSNTKSKSYFDFTYRSLDDTIEYTSRSYLDSIESDRNYALIENHS